MLFFRTAKRLFIAIIWIGVTRMKKPKPASAEGPSSTRSKIRQTINFTRAGVSALHEA
jgi:hypothetical protein